MKERYTWQQTTRWLAVVVGLVSFLFWIPIADAGSSSRVKISKRVPRSVAKAPVCDTYLHPKILKVTPDPVKPGQRITIKGKNFGTKRCFQKVSFGRWRTKSFRYVNDSTLQATVPKLKPGLTSVNILTAGGTSEYIVLIEKGKTSKRSKKVKRSKRSKRRARR